VSKRFQGIVGHVRPGEFLRGAAEDTGDIDGHVADADDGDALLGEVERQVPEVGMAIIPGDELGRRVAAGEGFSRNTQGAIGLGARRVADQVVELVEVLDGQVSAELYVAKESEAGVLGRFVVLAHDRFNLLVVRSDTPAHESIRGGEAIEKVHFNGGILEEVGRGVKTGGAGANDGYAKGLVG